MSDPVTKPLSPARLRFISEMLAQMVGVVHWTLQQSRIADQIPSAIARKMRMQLCLVEGALRRLIVLIAFRIPDIGNISKPKENRRADRPENSTNIEESGDIERKFKRFSLSEWPHMAKTHPSNMDGAPFWEGLNRHGDGDRPESFRDIDPFLRRVQTIGYVLKKSTTFCPAYGASQSARNGPEPARLSAFYQSLFPPTKGH